MTEKIRQGGLKKSAQQLKKLIKMDGNLQGAFALVPNGGKPYFFFSAAPTRTGAAGKVLPDLRSVTDTRGLICGTARYDDSQLFFEIGRLPGASPQVKSPRALQKSFRAIARGGLSALKSATINAGLSDDVSATDEDVEAVTGAVLSEEVLEALEAVEVDEADQAEIAAFIEATRDMITRMDAFALPTAPESASGLADLSGKLNEQRKAALLKEARAVFADRTALRQKILALVKADYSAAPLWNTWSLAAKLLREHVETPVARKLYRAELMEILDRGECRYSIDAVAVTGMGLAAYGLPLQHGFIQLLDMGSYVTIERGSPTGADTVRTNQVTHTFSYVKLSNMLGAALQAGGGSLVTTFQFQYHTKPKKFYLYRGYEQDCWSYIIDVCKMAGITPPAPGHTTNRAEAKRWKDDSIAGKLMTVLGLVADVPED